MANSILVTKLFVPPTRAKLVGRPSLIERLNDGLNRKLTLLSAPAGFGKTTLIGHWVDNLRSGNGSDGRPTKVAWLSLDEGDNDPARFLSYFIAAVNQAEGMEGEPGHAALDMLQSPQPPAINSILIALINDLASIPEEIIFILDDFHLVESEPIDQAILFLLENLPPQLHLVIATRRDPDLSLGRLRARDQLTELRAADLRFTSSEVAAFLNRVMGLHLTSGEIAELDARTEGWIAGLQLAAISMQGRKDIAGFIKSFSGSHRFVLDYLISEVLEQQSEKVQAFLLQTSILGRLTGALCDALCFENAEAPAGQDNGQTVLETLERANMFVVPLDDERRWYRYHHLVSESLRERLRRLQPERVLELHTRASAWYEQNDLIEEAMDHALRAKDTERAVHLIEQRSNTIWAPGENAKLSSWLEALPEELVLSRPQLSVFRAWELFASGRPDDGQRFLEAAELAYDHRTGPVPGTETQSDDEPASSNELGLRGRAAAIHAWIGAYRRDHVSGLIRHLRHALEYLPDRDLQWRSAVAITLADTYAFHGDMPAAYRARLEALKACEAAGNDYLYIYNSAKLALNLKVQGHLSLAQDLCQQRVRFAKEHGMSDTAAVGWLFAIMGDVLAETNDLDRALDHANKSRELSGRGGDVSILGWSCLCMTRVLFARAEMRDAEEIVQQLEKAAHDSIMPTWITDQNAAWQSRIWLAQGKLEAAMLWARGCSLGSGDRPTHMSGFKYLAMARVLISQGRWDEPSALLQLMLEAAEAGGDVVRVIEILGLQALAFHTAGETRQALLKLEQALGLAGPEGFVRIFVDEGPPMARLLYEALNRGIAPAYVQRLLAAFPTAKEVDGASSKSQLGRHELVEPVSEREVEVLQLIAEGLTNSEIASRLVLSLATVKTHARNIYAKLGVHNRTEAAARARALGILRAT